MTDVPPYLAGAALAAARHVWRGELAAARAALGGVANPVARLVRVEIELRAGAWDAAAALLDGWDGPDEALAPAVWRSRALLAAGRGDAGRARWLAGEAQVLAEAAGARWDGLEAWRADGLAAVVEGDDDRAVAAFEHVWQHVDGWVDPGAIPVGPDLVEALIAAGAVDRARVVNERLAAAPSPWARLAARRGAALLADDLADLGRVAEDYAALGLRFDAARTRLALGRTQARRRRWTAARAALTAAIEAFAAPGWSALAKHELAGLGDRPPRGGSDVLTRSERRVVDLAAAGSSNREIARALGVTINTVETHLSHAYAKLGVRGRAELPGAEG